MALYLSYHGAGDNGIGTWPFLALPDTSGCDKSDYLQLHDAGFYGTG